MDNLIFAGWEGIARTLIVGALAYVTLVGFLRISGKRTLSKMNAFDLVVTVALGSILATAVLAPDASFVKVAFGFALLIVLQFAVSWTSVRQRWVRQMVTGEPELLLHRGKILTLALRRARVTEDEVRAAIRAAGGASVDQTGAVVLETDGSFSVIGQSVDGAPTILEECQGYAEQQARN